MAINWLNHISTKILLIRCIILSCGLIIICLIWKSKPSGIQLASTQFSQNHPSSKKESEKLELELLTMTGYKSNPALLQQQSIEAEDLMQAEVENSYRVQRVRDLCRKFHLGKYHTSGSSTNDLGIPEMSTTRYETDYFYLIRKWGFSYCPVYKAGSSSMFINFLLLGGYTRQEIKTSGNFYVLAKEMYEWEQKNGTFTTTKSQEIEDSVKLLVVRHPFDRLLSAFLDKLANTSCDPEIKTFLHKYGQELQTYRTDPSITQVEPTWPEFVEYILNTDVQKYDDHWMPSFMACTPCLVNYDIIAKMETFSRDQAYFIHKLGLYPLKEPSWEHKHRDSTKQKDTAQNYFGQLTKTRIRGLVKIFLMDFLLFDYDPKDYLTYGKGD